MKQRLAQLRRRGEILLFSTTVRGFQTVRQMQLYDAHFSAAFYPGLTDLQRICAYLRVSGDDFLRRYQLPERGWALLPSLHVTFDTAWYLLRYFPKGLPENPLAHWLRRGRQEGLLPSPWIADTSSGHLGGWFDVRWYRDRIPILQGAGEQELLSHYRRFGAGEGKSPLPLFDPAFYLANLPEEERQRAEADPLAHFCCALLSSQGGGVQADPSPWFQRALYPQGPLHWLQQGRAAQVPFNCRAAQLAEVAQPRISILVPVYNPKPHFLNNCIRSVLYQAWPHWQLCLVDDGSSDPQVRSLLEQWAAEDERICVEFLAQNGGIAAATSRAAEMAAGEWLAFLDNDDELTPDALLEMAAAIVEERGEFFYSEEDLIGEDGRRFSTFRKPGWNAALLLSHNYIVHFVVVKKSLFTAVGGMSSDHDGAQDYDLMLKLSERAEPQRLDKVLYHWRASESSTSINHDEKSYAHEAGRTALDEALHRRGVPGRAVDGEYNFFYRIESEVLPENIATLALLPELCEESRTSLAQLQESCATLCIAAPQALRQELEGTAPLFPVEEKSGALLQQLLSVAPEAQFFALLQLPFLSLSAGWQKGLAAALAEEEIALACARRRFAGKDGPSQLLPQLSADGAAPWLDFLHSHPLHMNGLHCLQELFLPHASLVLLRRNALEELNLEVLSSSCWQVALCELALQLQGRGLRLVSTPEAEIDLPLSAALGGDRLNKAELQQRWGEELHRFEQFTSRGLLRENGVDEATFSRWLYGEDDGEKGQ